MSFEGKVAIVTGAGGGIGEVYATGLALEGASVVVADLDLAQAERVVDELTAKGASAIAVHVDVGDFASAEAMAAAATDAFGGIDLLVNNAAIYHGMRTDPMITVDLDYYYRFVQVNLHGAYHCTRACFPAMRERGGGAIVNQSSTASWMTAGAYSMTKAAINSLTVCTAAELGPHGIRVNAIAPGITDTAATRSVVPDEIVTPMVSRLPLARIGQPEDLVGACLFLLSDDARWVTGQIFAVDGGQTVRL